MPLQLTAASSRVQKATLKRANSSPFSSAKRRKPGTASTASIKRTHSAHAAEEDDAFELKLDDEGILERLASDLNFSDVVQLIHYISNTQWSPIPQIGAGMNSTRIAEILNFRKQLPPIVSVHHVHAMSKYPTTTEREIGTLVNAGVIRRITLPPRETGGTSPGEALVLVDDWEKCIRERSDIEDTTKAKYADLLRDPTSDAAFTQQEITILVHAGFLTGAAYQSRKADAYLRPGASTLGNLQSVSQAGIQHYSGSAEAVATGNKHHIAGGSGFNRRISDSRGVAVATNPQSTNLTLPNIGSYLKLLHESRAHLVSLLTKSNRYREMPMSFLKERWEGGVAGNDDATRAQRLRGEWSGVVPGRTRKWKGFSGLEFRWVLEECLGAGMVEVFNTGSVGVGVRAV